MDKINFVIVLMTFILILGLVCVMGISILENVYGNLRMEEKGEVDCFDKYYSRIIDAKCIEREWCSDWGILYEKCGGEE